MEIENNPMMINVTGMLFLADVVFMEVSSTPLFLSLTLVSPLRNWLNSTKATRDQKYSIFNLRYEAFQGAYVYVTIRAHE